MISYGSKTVYQTHTFISLYKLLRKVHPDCPLQLELLVGKTNPDQDGTVRDVFSDITLAVGTEPLLLIDVAVASPWGSAYLQYPNLSPIDQGGSSKNEEQSKRLHYSRIAAPYTPDQFSLRHPSYPNFFILFLNEVDLICQRCNGRILKVNRDR